MRALVERAVPDTETIHSPAGLDLGARVPAEVALSVLAEIVKRSPSLQPAYGTTCGAHEQPEATAGEEIRAVATAVKTSATSPHAPRDRSRLRDEGRD